jgi:hypothetical protein
MRTSVWLGLTGAILAIGCGSDSTPGPDGGGGAAGEASQAGGGAGRDGPDGSGGIDASETGGAGGAPAGSCTYDGQTYAAGSSFPATDGCNTCSCADGMVACTEMACAPDGTGGSSGCAGQPCGAQACTIEVQCLVPPCLPRDGYCDASGQCVAEVPNC